MFWLIYALAFGIIWLSAAFALVYDPNNREEFTWGFALGCLAVSLVPALNVVVCLFGLWSIIYETGILSKPVFKNKERE